MSLEGLSIPFADLSAPSVVLFGVVLIYFGYLIPRWQHKQWMAEKDARISEKDARIEEQSATIMAQRAQMQLVLEGAVNDAMHIARTSVVATTQEE